MGPSVVPPLQALLWDVDGTIAETEHDGHRVAFNLAFAEAGLDWHWDEARYRTRLAVTGGSERILAEWTDRFPPPHDPAAAAAAVARAQRLHQRKNAIYAERVAQGVVTARPGVVELMYEARAAGLRQAITTTTSRTNLDALLPHLLGPTWHTFFAVIVAGEDVQHKKPDPEVYRRAIDLLGVAPQACVALEDSPAGLAAATAAGVACVLTPSRYFPATAGHGALLVCGARLATLAGIRAARGQP